jgi:hypothetical protein
MKGAIYFMNSYPLEGSKGSVLFRYESGTIKKIENKNSGFDISIRKVNGSQDNITWPTHPDIQVGDPIVMAKSAQAEKPEILIDFKTGEFSLRQSKKKLFENYDLVSKPDFLARYKKGRLLVMLPWILLSGFAMLFFHGGAYANLGYTLGAGILAIAGLSYHYRVKNFRENEFAQMEDKWWESLQDHVDRSIQHMVDDMMQFSNRIELEKAGS